MRFVDQVPHRGTMFIGFLLLLPQSFAAAQTQLDKVTPADVFVRVALVQAELESLRYHMGRPKNEQPEIAVERAAPREVYFQALTLFRKSDRLCFEYTRERAGEPTVPEGQISPADVYEVVNRSLEKIRGVKQRLDIQSTIQPVKKDPTKQPNDVFRAIVQANRQLNLLLDRQFAPSDVFMQATLAVGYASRLSETFEGAQAIPSPPELEPGKQPADVYVRIIGCFERVQRIAKLSGEEILTLKIDQTDLANSKPSDVYDVAALLVSELAYLHSKLPGAQPPRKVYYSGRKFPSHVYQRVGILEQQLIELEKLVTQDPSWLSQDNNQ